MDVVYPRCCGLDVHKETVVACVRVQEGKRAMKEVRTFGTMTGDLVVLSDWLAAHQVSHVAMESTGIYWKPIFNLLETGFQIILVNAAHIKNVPGRKTDVKDCEWIAELLAHGLLKGSFIPPEPIRDLRDLVRYRKSLIDERVRGVNRLQKILEASNIKLGSVASNVMGASGRAMLEALAKGTTDPGVLADLARGQLRRKLESLRQALEGRFRPHHQYMIGQMLSHLDFLDEAIEDLSREVASRISPFDPVLTLLKTIPGVNQRVGEAIISEIGVDMSRFPDHRHLASWAGLCPGNNESAGKRMSGKVRKGNRWLRRTLIETSWAVCRGGDNYLNAFYHRLCRRRGKKKAAVGVAHAVLVTAYHMMKTGLPFRDLGADYFVRLNEASVKRYSVRRLEALGYKVTLETAQSPA